MTQNETEPQQQDPKAQAEAIINWFNQIRQIVAENFEEYTVAGQLGQHPEFGPMFVYTLEKDGVAHSCGFLLTELVEHFRDSEDPVLWLTSFFVDMAGNPESHPLPDPPQTEEETGAIVDKHIVPHCAESVRSEFPGEDIYVDLEMHPEAGAVLEAGFPTVVEGNNVCAMPVQYLMTLYLLNRDPAEPVIQAMYRLKEEQQA